MSQQVSVQIQAVLYQNDKIELTRALDAAKAAAKVAWEKGIQVSLLWGDASPEGIYSEEEWGQIQRKYAAFQKIEYRWFGENTGYGKGNNLLGLNATTDYLLVMNPEILLSPRTIVDLLAPFADPQVGLVEARQIPVEHPKGFDLQTKETEWASGACFMIPTALYQELEGFDTETFFMYCEDVDFSWRVRLAGKKLYYQTQAGVFHARRLSDTGEYKPSLTEAKYALLTELLLSYKWGYPEFAQKQLQMALDRGDFGSQEAAEEFARREAEGRLPKMQDPEHKIAKITQNERHGGVYFTTQRYIL